MTTVFGCFKVAGYVRLRGLGYRRDGPNIIWIRLYQINVNKYVYVSCSYFKPLVGAVWRGIQMSRQKVANAGTSRKKGAGRVACRLPFIVPMIAYTVRKEGGGNSA
jgi:hypothetical protein